MRNREGVWLLNRSGCLLLVSCLLNYFTYLLSLSTSIIRAQSAQTPQSLNPSIPQSSHSSSFPPSPAPTNSNLTYFFTPPWHHLFLLPYPPATHMHMHMQSWLGLPAATDLYTTMFPAIIIIILANHPIASSLTTLPVPYPSIHLPTTGQSEK